MNPKLFLITLSIFTITITHAQAQGTSSDHQAITTTIQNYFEGGANSDISKFKKAMHPNAFLKFISKGQYREIDMPTYYGFYKSGKKHQRKAYILSIDITGTAAAAKIRIETKKRVFTDYFTLLKFREGWRIVSKTSFTKSTPPNK